MGRSAIELDTMKERILISGGSILRPEQVAGER